MHTFCCNILSRNSRRGLFGEEGDIFKTLTRFKSYYKFKFDSCVAFKRSTHDVIKVKC